MDFHYRGNADFVYKTYWISDHKTVLSEQSDTSQRIYWAFVKIKYHHAPKEKAPDELYRLTLIKKSDQFQIQSCNFYRSVVTDTFYFKKRYMQPLIDTAKLLRRPRLSTPPIIPM